MATTPKATTSKTVTAALLLIGNELLSGRTQDANLNYLARQLTAMGIRLAEARVVADGEAEIVRAVNELRNAQLLPPRTRSVGAFWLSFRPASSRLWE